MKLCVIIYFELKSFLWFIEVLFIFFDESVCEYLYKYMYIEVCIVNILIYLKRNFLLFKLYFIVLYDLFVYLFLVC